MIKEIKQLTDDFVGAITFLIGLLGLLPATIICLLIKPKYSVHSGLGVLMVLSVCCGSIIACLSGVLLIVNGYVIFGIAIHGVILFIVLYVVAKFLAGQK